MPHLSDHCHVTYVITAILVCAEQFYEYFKQQNAAPTNVDQTDLEDTGVIVEEAGPLDYAI